MAKKKREEAHGGHGWFVTFADLMALLLAFGGGAVKDSDARSMLGTVDRAQVDKLLQLLAAGDLPAARSSYQAGLEIAERLAAQDKGNSVWQRDLSVSYSRLGDVDVEAGDLAAARPGARLARARRGSAARFLLHG